ncbi:Chromatin accessibility complex protein 1 [Clonorchis sinensis]|uniref:Chromatin accessibility complex protein 1 n=1 Tax=Clonorchis sinensis TaxID=79923 RepID=A0A3R7D0N5_CLOSI|nr:Chromatin accessibility complex protein 1 [Clonorchis sinensis]
MSGFSSEPPKDIAHSSNMDNEPTCPLRIQPSRTKILMKTSPKVVTVSAESAVCLSKATELFLGELLSRALKPPGLQLDYDDLSTLQSQNKEYQFLADVLPMKIIAKEWIERYKDQFDAACAQSN